MSSSRLVERQNAMIAVYIHLVRNQSMDDILEDNRFITNVSDFPVKFDFSEEMNQVIFRAVDRIDTYERAIDLFLNKWRFERLGYIEQAILLVACAELELGIQDKVVVVNEAVRLAKDYAEEESYKFINGVLDAI
ncbi:transcription antitermination protein NusB [Erysipelothrix sp. HDW6C]|uniref:transcription antitermination protein NusB n=1 Tax=Erysipelothrix sp. HDW6C TaxID=2714930 RepID=UPI001409FE89|nr:transcription antitermination protein NusB [Erysipelothrix sp. HDW6C]QIK70058.1 transcription antitermination protein NusB [Erysipelothrix sp. HDW6C]